ncbi:MAG: phage terminase large subunit [Pseudomonadota bacterium]
MATDMTTALDAILRSDFTAFLQKAFGTASGGGRLAPNWHHEAIAWELDRIRSGASTRLIVTMPPRYLKSITVSVAWVAWMLGHDPSLRFVCVSYSGDLAQKHASDCRAIMKTDWYRRIFPDTCIARDAEMDLRTTTGGGRLSTSVGGTLTGRGGNIIVIDDPIKPEDAMSETTRKRVLTWYANTLTSRLDDKRRGAIVLVMQRLHEEDLAGHLIEAGGWTHLSLPAIAEQREEIPLGSGCMHVRDVGEALHPDRESLEQLGLIKAQMGSTVYSAQYQQSPVPAEGLVVKRAWLQRYDAVPDRRPGDQIVQSWDTASKDGPFSDWSACVTALVGKRGVHVLDVFRGKLQFPDLKQKVTDLSRKHNTDVLLVEDAASGSQLIQVLRHEAPTGVPKPIARKPEADKQTRFAAASARIEAGELMLPREAPWLAEFEREVLGFPNLRHDDQADAMSQLLTWHQKRKTVAITAPELIYLDDPFDETGYW